MIKAESIEVVPIGSLIPHPKNMHQHTDDQIDRLVKLIEYQGMRNPIIVQKGTNLIVAGHCRLMALKKMGADKVPVIYQEFDSEAQLYAYMVSDNAIGKDTWASLDLSAINTEMLDLGPDFDIDMLGIKDFVIEPIEKFEPQADEDSVPEVVHPITRKGDLWILGKHRLLCGDSTMIDDVERLMGGEKADMVFTDPPYGVAYEGGHNQKKRDGIKNDKLAGEDLTGLFENALSNAEMITTDKAAFYIWYASGKSVETFASFAGLGLKVRAIIAWYKVKSGLGAFMAQYIPNYEPCIYALKEKGTVKWNGPSNEKTVWELKKDSKNEYHPTQKPVELSERAITNSSDNGDIVYDCFLGSGATLIGAEKVGRKCYGMELDEKYCDVIINRWQNYTGKKATLESTNQTYEELKVERDGEAV
jgi:DNA modification methylase